MAGAVKTKAWTRKEGQSPSGGLNQKGRDSYNKANPEKYSYSCYWRNYWVSC
jgi:hypothetical protein